MAYELKTRDEWDIEGYYAHGWEVVATEETWKDAREQLKCYRENEPGTAFRAVKHGVKNGPEPVYICPKCGPVCYCEWNKAMRHNAITTR